jgi:hypothetical protein
MGAGDWVFSKYTRDDDGPKGSSRSQMIIHCTLADSGLVAAAFLANGGVYDDHTGDLTLRCQHVHVEALGSDEATAEAVLTCEFWSANKAEATTPDQPFKMRLGWRSEAVILDPIQWKWLETGKDLAKQQPLLMHVHLTDIILYGCRSQLDLATYEAYEDTVNSDVFKGAAAGKVKYESGSANERQEGKSTRILWDVELHLTKRSVSWNQDYDGRAEPPGWHTPVQKTDGSTKKLTAVAYAPLLRAP